MKSRNLDFVYISRNNWKLQNQNSIFLGSCLDLLKTSSNLIVTSCPFIDEINVLPARMGSLSW